MWRLGTRSIAVLSLWSFCHLYAHLLSVFPAYASPSNMADVVDDFDLVDDFG